MPDLSWTASIDVTNVSKALSKIDREANELGVSFDKSFKTADEAIKYFGENISSLETALVRLRKEQADIKLLPQTQERTERLKELKIEVDDVTTSLRQNKKWQQDLSKAQKEDVGNTNTQITSFRSLFRIFQSGTKTSHSLAGGFKAINAVLKANPFGVVVLAAAAVVGVFKKLYNSLQPLKNLVDGISNTFNSLGTSIANALGMETVSQHDAKIKQLEEQKEKLDDLKESVSDIDKEIDKLKEKNKTPQQRLIEIDAQISGYEKDVDAYQKMWDKKSPQWQKDNSSGELATNLEGAKKQLELAKLQRDEIKKEIAEEDAKAKKAQAEEAERLKKQAEEFDKKRKSYLQALLDDSSDLKYAPRQREINWMEEGHDKVMAQIQLDYEKEIDSVKKYEKDKLTEYNKLYGTKYATIGELPQSVREPIQGVVGERTQNAESQRETSISNYYNGILSKYQDFETQRNNIRDKYANDAKQLRTKDTEESKAALAELGRAYKKELEANSVEQRNYIKANSDVLKKAFVGSTIKTKKELEEVITILENYKAVLGADNEADALNIGKKLGFTDEDTKKIWANGEKIQEEIEAVTEDIDNLKQSRTGLKKIADDFRNLAKSAKSGGLDFEDLMSTALGYADGLASALSSISETMYDIAEVSNNGKLKQSAKSLSDASAIISGAISGAKLGSTLGPYGALIGAFGGAAIGLFKKHIEFQKEMAARQEEYNRTLGETRKKYQELRNEYYGSGRGGSFNPNIFDETLIDKLNAYLTAQRDYQSTVNAGRYTGVRGRGGESDLEYTEKLTEKLEVMKNARDEFISGLSSSFGSLGNSLADSLVSAIQAGISATEDLDKSIDNAFESYYKQMLASEFNSWLTDYEKDIYERALNGEDLSQLREQMKIDAQGKALELRRDYADYFSNSDSLSSSTAKGIAQASQDSVDDLNGRFTAIQSHTYSINENMKEMQTRQAVILTEIMGIHTDTSSLKTMFINGTARVKIN